LSVVEINADERIAARVAFDTDDIDEAFAELDARYLAGEAAAHSRTWSAIARESAAFNRHELPAADWVTVDHRRLVTIDASEVLENIRLSLELAPDLTVRIEAVHRLTSLGAVVTYTGSGTSPDGFDAEWRMIQVLTVEGDQVGRCELFDEADLDAALARFEELHPQAPRPENAATQVCERFHAYLTAGDWDHILAVAAEDIVTDDRRRVVGAGVQRGRDVNVASLRASKDIGIENVTSTVIATRGKRLLLDRVQYSGRDQVPEPFHTEMLRVFEIDDEERISAAVYFDSNDIDAAFAELDARYLAGEAAAYSRTWSVISGACAAFNRHELAATTPGSVYVDHRPLVAVEAVDLDEFTRATWKIAPTASIYIEAVHRLNQLGAVVTQTARGISHDGFDAEWRLVDIFTVDGDLISRNELFDEADLDAALARFEELYSPAPQLENVATQATDRFFAYFAAHNWAAIAEILAEDSCIDDRRRVVNAGFWDGRDVVVANMRALNEGGANFTRSVIATRGQRLALIRICSSNRDPRHGEFVVEMLGIAEVNSDGRFAAHVLFDPDNIDAAYAELDARYLAGEAAVHAHTWSVIAQTATAFNRHELPAADWVNLDHRQLAPVDASDLQAAMRTIWDLTPDLSTHIEAVHRLTSLGAAVTVTAHGTSLEGFDAEWRMIDLLTVEGDRVNRCEMFDETDLDAALARFEELRPQERQLENAASQVCTRFLAHFAAGDWDAMAALLADNYSLDDRRRVVGAGIRDGRDAQIVDMRAIAEVWMTDVASTVIAIRGEHLVLQRVRHSDSDQESGAFHTDALVVGAVNDERRIVGAVAFDPDDIDAAFEELEARYLAGEAAAHAQTWSVVSRIYAGFNRHELPATTPDWIYVDHRPLMTIEPSDVSGYFGSLWEITPDISIYLVAVHRLSDLGAVVTMTARGMSPEGFYAEWRMILLYTFEGDLISRNEIFDEADLDAALARFDELDGADGTVGR
jgi:hypothetical protein